MINRYVNKKLFGTKPCSFCENHFPVELLYEHRMCHRCKNYLAQGKIFNRKTKTWKGKTLSTITLA